MKSEKFFVRSSFVSSITEWRQKRVTPPNIYSNIYDGSVFKTFKLRPNDPLPFTSESEYHLMLALNVDWYNVYNRLSSIPRKAQISEGSKYLKAAEWKTWAIAMAPQHLQKCLTASEFHNFLKFRTVLCKFDEQTISEEDVLQCHKLLIDFCKEFEIIYGKDKVNPNQHFHIYLSDCIKKHGPISCFWAFKFERYNMFVKNVNNNHKNIENTLIKNKCYIKYSADFFEEIQKKYLRFIE